MGSFIRMSELDLAGKNVLIREDLNVPLKKGVTQPEARGRAALPTIQMALDAGANVIVMSHLGRPTAGVFDIKYSLQPIADYLSSELGKEVELVSDWQGGFGVKSACVALLENVRFNVGESKDEDILARALSAHDNSCIYESEAAPFAWPAAPPFP